MTVISLRQRRHAVRPVEDELASIQRASVRLSRLSRTFSNWFLVLLVALATIVATRSGLMLMRCDNFMLGHDPTGAIVVWCRYSFSDIVPPVGVIGSRPFSALPVWQTIFMCVEAFLRATPALLILWFLHTLFRLFSKDSVFSPQISRQIRAITWTLLVYATIPAVAHVAYVSAQPGASTDCPDKVIWTA
jgi:hypothetical protein